MNDGTDHLWALPSVSDLRVMILLIFFPVH